MFPRIPPLVGAAILLCGGPASAEDARALLDKAIAVADAHKTERYAFTVVYTDRNAKPAGAISLRFDPRRPEGERWTLLSPAEASLTKDQRKRFKNLRRSNDADDSLIYDRLKDTAAKATLVSEDAVSARFSGPINDPKAPVEVTNSMEMTLDLVKAGGFVRTISVASKQAFRPAAAAKVERMEQSQTYEPLVAGGPAILRGSRTIAVGEAMFKKFDQHIVMEYRDFERVAPDQVAARP